jgi:hypothetical protein
MCGRFTRNYTWEQIHALYRLTAPAAIPNLQPRFNACPTDPADTIVEKDGWHLDEVFVCINGKQLYVWRAVDSEGEILDILVEARQDHKAALKLMRKVLKKQGITPVAIVTDKLRSQEDDCAPRAMEVSTPARDAPASHPSPARTHQSASSPTTPPPDCREITLRPNPNRSISCRPTIYD